MSQIHVALASGGSALLASDRPCLPVPVNAATRAMTAQIEPETFAAGDRVRLRYKSCLGGSAAVAEVIAEPIGGVAAGGAVFVQFTPGAAVKRCLVAPETPSDARSSARGARHGLRCR